MSQLLQIHEPGQTPAPHEDTVAVGIDLGTTHSVVSLLHQDDPVVIEKEGVSTVPSVVAYHDNGVVVVGEEALSFPNHVSSIKRLMGKGAAEAQKLMPHFASRIESAEQGTVPRIRFAENIVKTPVELSAEILRYMKQMAEEETGKTVEKAVITVPAYFDDAARLATKDAAVLAGLEVLRLINEPTAAAVAYGLEHTAEGVYAVYDLGGGTFDISLLNLEKGVFQVLSTAGDVTLGGDDVDEAIAACWLGEGGEAVASGDRIAVLRAARYAKESLLQHAEIKVEVLEGSYSLNREELAELCDSLVKRTLQICGQALEDASLAIGDVSGVVLVGGSTRLSVVREAVERFFQQTPLCNVDPDRVVSYGAATQAYHLTEGGDHLLLDVAPLSLGLEMMGGLVEKIIWRNTPIPAAVAQEFTTYQDGQTAISIHVVQGEREMVGDCRSLAKFVLSGIPPMAAGAAKIRVTFQLDADGLLTVFAEDVETGNRQELSVQPTYGLPVEEMEKMLRSGMENAKEDILNRMLAEARMEAERTLSDVHSALEKDGALLSESEERVIFKQIQSLEEAIAGENRDLIDAMHNHLQHLTASFAQKRMDKAIGKALKGVDVDDV